jgi:hypothetical protein
VVGWLIPLVVAAQPPPPPAPRPPPPPPYGDYLDLVETATEVLAELRDNYAAALEEDAAEEYEEAFNRAVLKRLPRFALEIEDT